MFSKYKWITGLALAAGLTFAGPTAAFAGNTPAPSPSYTHPPVPTPRAAQWQFDFTSAAIDGLTLNDVRGTAPIVMSRWTETDNTPTTSTFSRGPNSVKLRHNRLPLPAINLNTCTATFDQLGNFRIINGTGTGAGFAVVPGTDIYLLRGVVSLDFIQKRGYHSRHGNNTVCPLQLVTPGQVRAELEANGPVAGQLPSLVDFDVQGNAKLIRTIPLPTPSPTGPSHFFAPATNPAGSPSS